MMSQQPFNTKESSLEAASWVQPDAGERAIRGGAIRVGGYVTGVLVSLGAAAVLVRHLGISGFGRYVTVVSLIALVGGVTEAGIAVYGIREFGTRDGPDRRRLMADLLGMRLTLTLVGVVCAVGFGLVVGYADVLVVGSVLAGAGLLVQVVADVLSIPLQAELRLGRLTFVEFTRRLVTLLLIGVLAIVGASLLPFFGVSIVAGIGAVSLLAWMVRSSVRHSRLHRGRLLLRHDRRDVVDCEPGRDGFVCNVLSCYAGGPRDPSPGAHGDLSVDDAYPGPG